MRMSIPPRWRKIFWHRAPKGRLWFRYPRRPDCQEGEEIVFTQDRRPVARAVAEHIDPPGFYKGRPEPDAPGWKLLWKDFEDLRDGGAEEGFKPNLHGGYA